MPEGTPKSVKELIRGTPKSIVGSYSKYIEEVQKKAHDDKMQRFLEYTQKLMNSRTMTKDQIKQLNKKQSPEKKEIKDYKIQFGHEIPQTQVPIPATRFSP
jgi:seryl-tRNA synthetase